MSLAERAREPIAAPETRGDVLPTRQPRHRIGQVVYTTSGFFVLRSPVLPVDEFLALGEDLAAPAAARDGVDDSRLADALASDRRLVSERLAAAARRPVVREAVHVASPSLAEQLAGWDPGRDDGTGRGLAHGLNRYFCRMACRPTPFGLFAGCSLGRIDDAVNLALAPADANRRRTRLDMNYLSQLFHGLEADPAVRAGLRYTPNPILYRAAGRLRYIESRVDGTRRSHHLVAVDPDAYLDHVLAAAAEGATLAELAAALVELDAEIANEEADAYLEELVAAQLLVSEFALPVTGPDAAGDLLQRLRRVAPDDPRVATVEQACERLAALDAGGVEDAPAAYRDLARGLRDLPVRIDDKHLVQIDLFKPGPDLGLDRGVGKEVLRAVETLYRLRPAPFETPIDSFKKVFYERYGEREVPLTDVLDEEVGLGFLAPKGPMSEDAPLLAGLGLPQLVTGGSPKPHPAQRMLLEKLTAAAATGATSVEITDDDLEGFPNAGPALAEAQGVLCTLAASSADAVAAGDFTLRIKSVSGPSGARLLGRFCHLDEDLRDAVAAHLRQEEALRPEAIFAEIVHLPEGRLGNILYRPLLRPWEITISGRSAAEPERRIAVSDLALRLEKGRLVLRSRRLDREIVPRLTSAHNYGTRSIGLYKFLCNLQLQNTLSGLGWTWGMLDQARFLPRVTCGRVVLSRAAWRLDRADVEKLIAGGDVDSYRAVQELRRERGLPRLVEVADGDNCLPVDLDSAVSVGTLLHLIKQRHQVVLEEFYPGPDEMPVTGPEGVYANELVVPIVKQAEPEREEDAPEDASMAPDADATPEVFLPGSEWLYAKLYCGSVNADRVLADVVRPLVVEAGAAGSLVRWFFLRYSDPDWHLRLRLRARTPAHASTLLVRLHELAAPLQVAGVLQDVAVASYTRETARYGGPTAIAHAEEMFAADSEAVAGIVGSVGGDGEARWRLALAGSDLLLADLGYDLEGRREVIKKALDGYRLEFGVGKSFNKKVGKRFRAHHDELDALLFAGECASEALARGRAYLLRRRERWAGACAALRELDAREQLVKPLEFVARSFVHMHANRLLRSAARAQELVICDLLFRTYDSRLARMKSKSARARKKHARGHA